MNNVGGAWQPPVPNPMMMNNPQMMNMNMQNQNMGQGQGQNQFAGYNQRQVGSVFYGIFRRFFAELFPFESNLLKTYAVVN